ncbi:glycine cleavage system protein GcvH [Micromonospora peucetia]|uniref:Glycine cleavage system H protein n=1 Tax=Micromonospora peucetia TaxID=47871 RepID=A0A1C6W2Q1_9ACTN|nr:glycine cleavage system protein GcvH [Micromonospora peucetia]MCX4391226.1 glycine cleavage system protein GcvH [Micromonospora peucetia]SCL72843.1 glycine cleavage system H protein [Micromonospora peucetia]
MDVPARLRYSTNHEWIDDTAEPATVGITAFAAAALGDVIYAELPEPGTHLAAGEVCGEVESTKSVAELYMPVSGEIVATNEAVVADPGLIGADPYVEGWLFRVRLTDVPPLMTADEYRAHLTETDNGGAS